MWYLWLIFAILFVLIPIGVIKLKQISKKRIIQITEEQEKYANFVAFKLILFYWLCDLFFMSFIIDSLVCKLILGGLIMLIIFYNLSNVFVGGKNNSFSHFAKWGMMQDFVVGVSLSIYLIYIVPNADLQNIIIPIVAGVYGGLLTLVGVAWTIRENEERNRKKNNKFGIFNYMLRETIRVCEEQEIFFDKGFFEKYILPQIDGEKSSRDDVITSRICNNPFIYDKEIIDFSVEGEISDKMFQVYDLLKKSYKNYIQMRITFYDHDEVYEKSKIEYSENLIKAKKLVESTNE